jgi:hypothetical protein
MRARPTPDAEGTGSAAPSQRSRRSACQVLYRAGVMRLSALLDKIGVHRTAVQLAKDYGLDRDETLRACVKLTPAQLRCVLNQANPLFAGQACRLADSLGLTVPQTLMALLRPRSAAIDDAKGRRQLADLRGRWVRQGPAGRRVEIVISSGGRATFRRFRDNRPDGDVDQSMLSIRHQRELLRRRTVTTQRYVFFPLDRDTFLLSGNPLHTATPIRNKSVFQLILARDRVLRRAADQCEVIDLAHLAAHAATCTWDRDAVTRIPMLKVAYTLGRWELQERFFLVRAHLIHERLYQRRFVRR